MGEQKHPLDEIVERVAADPAGSFTFSVDGQPAAVLVNHAEWQRLRDEAGISTDLELALDAVLSRYGIQMFGFPNQGDRGDLVSDLAEVARDYFGRGRR